MRRPFCFDFLGFGPSGVTFVSHASSKLAGLRLDVFLFCIWVVL